MRFSTLGVYQMLIPILDNKYVVHYYEQIVEKLVIYDSKHQSDLLETAVMYIKCDGDIKTTASALFQHDNTVRYRIRKINTLLSLDDMIGAKYETLAIAIHLYELNKKQNKFNLL
jgi:DNA-binding PucR family transcriptional regulator